MKGRDDDISDEGDDALEHDFPLGDGTADTAGTVDCPYCGELNEVHLDPGSGAAQEYVEDCQVCCQPWRVRVDYDARGGAQISVRSLDD